MSRAAVSGRNQLRQLTLVHAREAFRDRRGIVTMLLTFGAMIIGLAVLDLLLAWHTGTRLPGAIMGAGVLARSLPLVAIVGFSSLALVSTAVPLTAYRADGVLRQLGTTPVSHLRFIATHLPVRLVLGLAQIAVLLTLAALFASPVSAGFWWWASALMFAALLFLLSVGYVVGAHFSEPERTMGFAYMLMIALIATSGTALPLEALPHEAGAILGWFPTTLFAQGFSSELRGTTPAVLPSGATVLLLLSSALSLFALSIRNFRWVQTARRSSRAVRPAQRARPLPEIPRLG